MRVMRVSCQSNYVVEINFLPNNFLISGISTHKHTCTLQSCQHTAVFQTQKCTSAHTSTAPWLSNTCPHLQTPTNLPTLTNTTTPTPSPTHPWLAPPHSVLSSTSSSTALSLERPSPWSSPLKSKKKHALRKQCHIINSNTVGSE